LVAIALVHHSAKVLKYLDELDRYLEASAKSYSVVEATDVFWWFTFDVMGDFTLSKSFGMLENRKWHEIILKLKNARALLGPLSPAPWLLHLGIKLLPRVAWVRDWYDSVEWCALQMQERLAKGKNSTEVPDLTYYLMERVSERDDAKAKAWLTGDSLLAILAGRYATIVSISPVCFLFIQLFDPRFARWLCRKCNQHLCY
jgi:tryprostatin B 6-hydroxylase